MIYQTDSDFPTDAVTLLERFRIQTGKEDTFIITNDKKPTTDQSGIFEFHGTRNDEYLGILATIVWRTAFSDFDNFYGQCNSPFHKQ